MCVGSQVAGGQPEGRSSLTLAFRAALQNCSTQRPWRCWKRASVQSRGETEPPRLGQPAPFRAADAACRSRLRQWGGESAAPPRHSVPAPSRAFSALGARVGDQGEGGEGGGRESGSRQWGRGWDSKKQHHTRWLLEPLAAHLVAPVKCDQRHPEPLQRPGRQNNCTHAMHSGQLCWPGCFSLCPSRGRSIVAAISKLQRVCPHKRLL